MIDDKELELFVDEWWRGFMIYEAEEGRAYCTHLFKHVHKKHFVDFLRDALAEFCEDN